MIRVRILALTLAVCCLLGLGISAAAAEVDCDTVYCFTGEEFSQEEEPLVGVCITGLPEANAGTVMLGSRVLHSGDILTARQLPELTFHPLRTTNDTQAVISYLPIYENRVEKPAAMTIGIRGKEDKAPVAQDSSIETYKNLPGNGNLKVTDPEGQCLTYTVVRGPKRGSVEIRDDGSFAYTPKKNKVGVDSFTYTAADAAGNVSREATVTIQILKPTDARQYTDTVGEDCRFEAEWLRNSGLFVGEQVSGSDCFYPEKTVSRGDFLAMVVKVLDIPLGNEASEELPADAPQWLKPYLAAAQRSGLLADVESGSFAEPISGADGAVILQNALDLTVSSTLLEDRQVMAQNEELSDRAAACLAVMAENGVDLPVGGFMTRADAAKALYRISRIAPEAPGTAVFRQNM